MLTKPTWHYSAGLLLLNVSELDSCINMTRYCSRLISSKAGSKPLTTKNPCCVRRSQVFSLSTEHSVSTMAFTDFSAQGNLSKRSNAPPVEYELWNIRDVCNIILKPALQLITNNQSYFLYLGLRQNCGADFDKTMTQLILQIPQSRCTTCRRMLATYKSLRLPGL